jgi:hypothetical protein
VDADALGGDRIEEVGSNSKGETSVICTKGRYAISCRRLEIYRETLLSSIAYVQ